MDDSPPLSRRHFLQAGTVAVLGSPIVLSGSQVDSSSSPEAPPVRAIVFDVFGTVVDWRTSVAREVEALARSKGLTVDGARFADAWRGGYGPSMDRVRKGELPWTRLDALHRMTLDGILPTFGLTGLTEAETDSLNRAWHRQQPWPDVVSGLTRLKRKYIIAPLSNGNISLMTDMARHAGLPWDCILGAELVRHYKPDGEVYRSAPDFLDLKPVEVMMVAAHVSDLHGAKKAGLTTTFVPRPLEYGPGAKPDLMPDASVDLTITDFNDLATRLGA